MDPDAPGWRESCLRQGDETVSCADEAAKIGRKGGDKEQPANVVAGNIPPAIPLFLSQSRGEPPHLRPAAHNDRFHDFLSIPSLSTLFAAISRPSSYGPFPSRHHPCLLASRRGPHSSSALVSSHRDHLSSSMSSFLGQRGPRDRHSEVSSVTL